MQMSISRSAYARIRDINLANDLRWLSVVNCLQVLLHRRIIIAFFVQIVPILSKNDIALMSVNASLLRKIDC